MSSKDSVFADRHALQAIAEQADLIGRADDGSVFLLIRTTPELLSYLEAVGADTEDLEGSEAEGEYTEVRKVGQPCPTGFVDDDEAGDEDSDVEEHWVDPARAHDREISLFMDDDREPDDERESPLQPPEMWR